MARFVLSFLSVCMLLGSTIAQFCPAIWDPVCGTNPLTRSIRTFSNLCELESNQESVFGQYRLLHRGECENRGGLNSPCPTIYQPVCGINRRNGHHRTFSNECVLRTEGWIYEYLHEGECFTGPQACTLQWDPICATRLSDGSQRTFSNECLLRVEQSNNPGERYQYSHHGECNEYQAIQPFGRSFGSPIESEGFAPYGQQSYFQPQFQPIHSSSYEEHDHQDHEESSTNEFGGHHSESSSSSHSESQGIQPFGRRFGQPIESEGLSSNHVCSFIYLPVCAIRLIDGSQKTFSNECLLRNQQTWNPQYRYVFLHEGECRQSCNTEPIVPYGQRQIIGDYHHSYYQPIIQPIRSSTYEEHDHQDHEESSTNAFGGHHAESSSSSHSEANSSPNYIRRRY